MSLVFVPLFYRAARTAFLQMTGSYRSYERLKNNIQDCALTLSIGEKSEESYRAYREAGADRYLLRHETADLRHYMRLHPLEMSGENRKSCLRILKKLGYQTGAGFMVGSPLQTVDDLVEDFLFLKELDPEMVGIGPFIAHQDTPFCNERSGTLDDTLFYLALLRLMFPNVRFLQRLPLGRFIQEEEKWVFCQVPML